MVQDTTWQPLALRALILAPLAVVAVRTDITKFRGWRQRVREWQAKNAVPPTEYQRDNELWRWRLLALVVSLGALLASAILMMEATPPMWLFWSVYVVAMLGAAAWNLLGGHVR